MTLSGDIDFKLPYFVTLFSFLMYFIYRQGGQRRQRHLLVLVTSIMLVTFYGIIFIMMDVNRWYVFLKYKKVPFDRKLKEQKNKISMKSSCSGKVILHFLNICKTTSSSHSYLVRINTLC